jgi:hypothetical protein
MVNFLCSPKLNRILVSCVLTSFTLGTLPFPVYAAPAGGGINLNDISFAIRIEKLIEKINRYRERRDSEKLLETMFDLKLEVEGYTGQKIDLDKQLDQVEKDIKAQGGKLKKDEMKSIRKFIHKKEKRSGHKTLYMANCLEFDLPYNAEEEQILFQNDLLMATHGHDKGKDDDKEISIPLRVTIGVTVALCGLFLYFVPIPVCKVWGPELMKAGVALAVEGTINRVEADDKDKKDKK